tara:strand:+ start:877 stop:3060 length:2184 start_codon:yes stop_codon:yes gene_type:complete
MAIIPKRRKITPEEEDVISSTQWDRYTRARDNGHVDYVDLAKKCDAYYQGEQWDSSDIAALDAEGRPALTINTILPTINTVLGEQVNRRADIRFKPRRGAEQETADTLTKLFSQIADNNKLDWVEQQVFTDGLIMDGRGYFDVRIDFSDNMQGEVRITAKDPLDIILDPDAKEYDSTTWNEVFETKWMTLDEIEELYGKEQADKLLFIAENGQTYGRDSVEYYETRYGDTDDTDDYIGTSTTGYGDEYRSVKALRVIERQYKKLHRIDCFVDKQNGDMRPVPENWSAAKTKKFAKQYDLDLYSKMKKRVRWTVTCDKVVLFDDWSPYDEFTIVPYFAYFRRGRPFGMVRNLLSPQEQLNKVASQELHIVNTTANSGWLVESGSLTSMQVEDLEEHGAETGLVLEYNRGSTPPGKIQPNQIPTGLDRISLKAANNIKEISGINDSMLGTDSAEVSGVAIQAKQNRGIVMIQVPLDNLKKTRLYLAEKVLNIIQQYYTEERVIMIANGEASDEMEQNEMMVINQQVGDQIINDITIGEYDVVVNTTPARDSFDEVQFAEALNLRQVGVAIPDDAIVQYSNLNDKTELARRIRTLTGQEPPSPEQQQLLQIQQQFQFQQLQLEIAKLEAEVQKLQSEAQVNLAKAQDVSSVQPQLQLAEAQAKLEMKQRELDLRRELSALTNSTRQSQAETQAASKIAATAMSNAAKNNTLVPEPVEPTPPGPVNIENFR